MFYGLLGTRVILDDNHRESCSPGLQRFLLLMVILQSVAIRALPMQGMISGVIICLLLVQRVELSAKSIGYFAIAAAAFLALSIRSSPEASTQVFLGLVLLTGFLFATFAADRWASLELDLLEITWWLSVHALASFVLYKLASDLFSTVELGGMRYRVFGVFIITGNESDRATGLCWEPGLLQYLANLCLFLGIRQGWRAWKLAIPFAVVVTTFSTAGIFALVPTLIYLLTMHHRSTRQWLLIGAAVLAVGILSLTVFKPNIEEKLGGVDTSGLVRLRDLEVGWELIEEKPLLGHGQLDEPYLVSKSTVYEIVDDLFSKEYLTEYTDMAGGYTNGFLALLAGYGLVIGGLLYVCFLRNRLIQGGVRERLVFFFISIITFVSEPITNTAWFFALAISGLPRREADRDDA